MLAVNIAGWAATLGAIAGLLALDWLMLGRRAEPIGLRDAAAWSVLWVALAVLFGVVLGLVAGWDPATQYFAGYVVERSLSIDNLFVFVLIIGAFAVPPAQQPKALTIGIGIALGARVVLIALGAALLSAFSFMYLLFGLGLLLAAVRLARGAGTERPASDNAVVAAARRRLPISARYEGNRLLTVEAGRRRFTPLLLALLAIGTTDVLFALDSIPAIFGVTTSAYIVFAANAYALLGMRPLYFLIAGLLDRLVHLSTGLALVLGFIAIKLILEFAHHENHAIPQISTAVSLAVVAALIAATIVASYLTRRRRGAAAPSDLHPQHY
jgi:tellurite resistance protein TerC